MKNLIFQYYKVISEDVCSLPRRYRRSLNVPYWEMSSQSISAYARKVEADYIFDTSTELLDTHYSIFIPFITDLYKHYDNICFIDSDVLATACSSNIFLNIDSSLINLVQSNTGPMKVHKFGKIADWQNRTELNSGVVVFPKSTFRALKNKVREIPAYYERNPWSNGGYDQEILFDFAIDYGYNNLHYKFNYMLSYYNNQHKFDNSLIHYHYTTKHLLEKDFNRDEILK